MLVGALASSSTPMHGVHTVDDDICFVCCETTCCFVPSLYTTCFNASITLSTSCVFVLLIIRCTLCLSIDITCTQCHLQSPPLDYLSAVVAWFCVLSMLLSVLENVNNLISVFFLKKAFSETRERMQISTPMRKDNRIQCFYGKIKANGEGNACPIAWG